jgi:hypothetical protein
MSVKLTDTGIQFPNGRIQTKAATPYLTAGFDYNLPFFRATYAGYPITSNDTTTKIPLNSYFDSTGSQLQDNNWVAPKDGYYLVTVKMFINANNTFNIYQCYNLLKKNNSTIVEEWGNYIWDGAYSLKHIYETSFSCVVYLLSGYYLNSYTYLEVDGFYLPYIRHFFTATFIRT